MSDVIRKFARALGAAEPPKPVAGYLPAPKQARFVSRAEEAAQRLPANIKAQSVPNQLHKFGAKPVELEYAGLSDFLKGKDKVSSQDVLAHLQQQGPLGQLKRVDQGDAPQAPRPWQDHTDQGEPFGGVLGQDDLDFVDNDNFLMPGQGTAPRNFYQSDPRKPFGSDARGSFNDTAYASITVPGRQGDFTGYREVLLEDPQSSLRSSGRQMLANGKQDSIDSHKSDYWLRYNNLPDRVAIQNIQSDVGQRSSGMPKRLKELNDDLAVRVAHRDELKSMLDSTEDGNAKEEIIGRLSETESEIEWLVEKHEDDFPPSYTDAGEIIGFSLPEQAESPIAKDNNWKNLMLRHALLESVNQSGKPITIPTGHQMVDVEQFGAKQARKQLAKQGVSTDDPRYPQMMQELQELKASSHNEDLAARLLKAFKEIHPKGATMVKHDPPAPLEPPDATQVLPLTRGEATIQDMDFYESLLGGLKSRDELRKSKQRDEILARSGLSTVAYKFGNTKPTLEALEGLLDEGRQMSPQSREAVLKAVQYNRLMQEMGMDAEDLPLEWFAGEGQAPSNDAPGWTIKPHPETVRAALEKGVPIMSIAPFLLQQSLMSQQEENR